VADLQTKNALYDNLIRFRRNDPEGFRRLVEALEVEYRAYLDDWVMGKSEDLAKFQGAALAYRQFLELFKHVLTAS
jgi:hypothetical protein